MVIKVLVTWKVAFYFTSCSVYYGWYTIGLKLQILTLCIILCYWMCFQKIPAVRYMRVEHAIVPGKFQIHCRQKVHVISIIWKFPLDNKGSEQTYIVRHNIWCNLWIKIHLLKLLLSRQIFCHLGDVWTISNMDHCFMYCFDDLFSNMKFNFKMFLLDLLVWVCHFIQAQQMRNTNALFVLH